MRIMNINIHFVNFSTDSSDPTGAGFCNGAEAPVRSVAQPPWLYAG